jgi:hypothetical protein
VAGPGAVLGKSGEIIGLEAGAGAGAGWGFDGLGAGAGWAGCVPFEGLLAGAGPDGGVVGLAAGFEPVDGGVVVVRLSALPPAVGRF